MNFTDGNASHQVDGPDKMQNLPRAGKVKPEGDQVQSLLQELSSPATPEVVRRFRSSLHPEPGAVRVHFGTADDPDVASSLVHGISTKSSLSSGNLINPPKKTVVQEKLEEMAQAASRKRFPLSRSCGQRTDLRSRCSDETIFGVKTIKDLSAREIVNPPKTSEELEKEAQEEHEAYARSHNAYFVGEKIDRKYDRSHYSEEDVFGIKTAHFADGRLVGQCLRWQEETQDGRDDFHQPSDHIFGTASPSDQFGVGEIIHSAEPGESVRDGDRQRGRVNAVRHHLKKVNFHNFRSLLKAFNHYDKKGKGMIDREDLQAVCREFQLDASERVLDGLMDYCDTDKDGLINFREFACFLNWKDMMPINREEESILTNNHHSSTAPVNRAQLESAQLSSSQALVRPEDLEPVGPGSSLKTIRAMGRPKADADHFVTSSSLIGADSDGPLKSTVRSDLPAPLIKRVSGASNHSDRPRAADLLYPSVYALRGVHEEHLFCPRTKKEIEEIFRNAGANLPDETFEEAWKLATMKQPNGEVSVELFRDVLKEIKAM